MADAVMSDIQRVCVYCGSSPGSDPAFIAAARQFGRILADNRVGLVYGGGSGGLMGAIAETVREHGGHVTGIIPQFLVDRERMFKGANELVITADMHERKRLMFERADAFVAFPGGIGTLEELVEMMTWAQLGHHRKPIVLANINGFWRALVEVFAHMKQQGFIHNATQLNYHVVDALDDILPTIVAAAARVSAAEIAGEAATVEKL
jgi:uncharacterized protein (TIGR00730 family)